MSDVTKDELLAGVNKDRKLSMRQRVGRILAGTIGVLLIFWAGAVTQNLVGGWWNQRKLDRQNMDAMVLIVQYNMGRGKLDMPPQLMPAPPTPAAAPTSGTSPQEPVKK